MLDILPYSVGPTRCTPVVFSFRSQFPTKDFKISLPVRRYSTIKSSGIPLGRKVPCHNFGIWPRKALGRASTVDAVSVMISWK